MAGDLANRSEYRPPQTLCTVCARDGDEGYLRLVLVGCLVLSGRCVSADPATDLAALEALGLLSSLLAFEPTVELVCSHFDLRGIYSPPSRRGIAKPYGSTDCKDCQLSGVPQRNVSDANA